MSANDEPSVAPYTPFEDCPHTWCLGCGTCHVCEAENPPRLVAPARKSSVRGRVIPRRSEAGEHRG